MAAGGAFSLPRAPAEDVTPAGNGSLTDPGERQGAFSVDDKPPLRHEGGELRPDLVTQLLGKVVIRGRVAGLEAGREVADEGLLLRRDVGVRGPTVRRETESGRAHAGRSGIARRP